jgi:signal transduction histidine kinase
MELFFVAALATTLFIALWLLLLLHQRGAALCRERKKNEHLQNLMQLLQSRDQEVRSSLRTLQKLRHDLRHYLLGLEEQDRSRGGESGEQLQAFRSVLEQTAMPASESSLITLLEEHYREQAKRLGTAIDIKLDLGERWNEMTLDLYLILGNLLENALEALSREGNGGWLRVRSTTAAGWFSLVVGNSSTARLRVKNGRYLSSKAEGRFGIGLETVRNIAEQYGGKVEFTADGTSFKASVFLPRAVTPPQKEPARFGSG